MPAWRGSRSLPGSRMHPLKNALGNLTRSEHSLGLGVRDRDAESLFPSEHKFDRIKAHKIVSNAKRSRAGPMALDMKPGALPALAGASGSRFCQSALLIASRILRRAS